MFESLVSIALSSATVIQNIWQLRVGSSNGFQPYQVHIPHSVGPMFPCHSRLGLHIAGAGHSGLCVPSGGKYLAWYTMDITKYTGYSLKIVFCERLNGYDSDDLFTRLGRHHISRLVCKKCGCQLDART